MCHIQPRARCLHHQGPAHEGPLCVWDVGLPCGLSFMGDSAKSDPALRFARPCLFIYGLAPHPIWTWWPCCILM